MAHIRNDIRDAIAELLFDETEAGENVFTNRETPLWEAELPAILIYTKSETAIPRSLNSNAYIRQLQLIIEIKVLANDTLDDTLDDLAQEVEEIVSIADIEGSMGRPVYKGTEINLDSGSETEKGIATLTYEIQYIQ